MTIIKDLLFGQYYDLEIVYCKLNAGYDEQLVNLIREKSSYHKDFEKPDLM